MKRRNSGTKRVVIKWILLLFIAGAGNLHAQPKGITGDTVSSPGNQVMVIFQDSRDVYWFGSSEGLYRYDGRVITHFTKAHGLPDNYVYEIAEDKLGKVYFNTQDGVCRFDSTGFTRIPVVTNSSGAWRLHPDDLWFRGFRHPGVVFRYDGLSLYSLEFPGTIPGQLHDVHTIHKDSRGHLWFGTSMAGVCRYDGMEFMWMSPAALGHDMDSLGIRSIIEDRHGRYWFSNTQYQFDIYTDATTIRHNYGKPYRMYDGFGVGPYTTADNAIAFLSAVKDREGDLWLLSWSSGVFRYDGRKLSHYPLRWEDRDIAAFHMYRDRGDALWVVTHEHGAFRFDGKSFVKFMP